MANFFVVRQPPAHPSGLHFGFFRCPPTTGSSVRSTIRIASLSRHYCLSDEVLAHPVSYPIPYKKGYHIVFLNATTKSLRYGKTFYDILVLPFLFLSDIHSTKCKSGAKRSAKDMQMIGFEPTRVSPSGFKPDAFSNYATSAKRSRQDSDLRVKAIFPDFLFSR